MARYKVTHRLGCYIQGLGSRPFGGEFDVPHEKAARLRLDESPVLERIDGRAKRKSKAGEPAVDTPDKSEEG